MKHSEFWDSYVTNKLLDGKVPAEEWGNSEGFIEELVSLCKPNYVALEIGCGSGRITKEVYEKLGRIHAFDVSLGMINECRKNIKDSACVTFHRCLDDVVSLFPIEDESIDLVFSHDVFVHFDNYEVMCYFNEISRVLKPGGKALISFFEINKDNVGNYDKVAESYNESKIMFQHRVHNNSFVIMELVELMSRNTDLEIIDHIRNSYLIITFANYK